MSKDSVTLNEKLKQKLENGEISQEEYDELMSKFENLDLLGTQVGRGRRAEKAKSWKFTGSKRVEGDNINEFVKVSGKLVVDGPLKCLGLKVSGSTVVHGDLTTVEGSSVSGKIMVNGVGKFGGITKVSGSVSGTENLYFTAPIKISGKLIGEKDIVCGDALKISGKIKAHQLKSNSEVKVSGKVGLANDLVAKEYICSGVTDLGGSLLADLVEINKRYREQHTGTIEENVKKATEEAEGLESIPDLGKFVANIVSKFVPMAGNFQMGTPKMSTILGNIEGKNIDVTYVDVKGDIVGDDIVLGPEVKVTGVVKYRNTVTIPEELQDTIKVEKIE